MAGRGLDVAGERRGGPAQGAGPDARGVHRGQQLLFQPQDTINRAEITTVVWRIYAYTSETPHEPEVPEEPETPEEPEEPETPPNQEPGTPSEPTGDYFYFGS